MSHRCHRCLRPLWPALNAIDTLPRQGYSRSIFANNIRCHICQKTCFTASVDIVNTNFLHCTPYGTTSINEHVMPLLPLQGTVQPIVAREELRMHIRHRSFMGLMLDGALCSELATRYAFCNLVVHARAMTRHYTDSHPELVGPARQQYDFVSGLSNLVSGKVQCPMCQCKSLDVQKFTCPCTSSLPCPDMS